MIPRDSRVYIGIAVATAYEASMLSLYNQYGDHGHIYDDPTRFCEACASLPLLFQEVISNKCTGQN